ncbi:DUF4440 domain-containing protein [Cryobacterium algoritolerans]|uniref:DUF4440 domain-containing protein n=1 Tax=Cryobacterium algoritolerans TaxID=1259184 RepID=A0A4R8WV30_9MICO|nr:nuclear transport factor 2 family protein [Cryobacterium algoritolerans]TFC17636.1 DUF4440 domain-containing protein [Cryobacterium algoritolerans]
MPNELDRTGLVAEALAAADTIIDDFGHHRRDAYFAGFAAEATFVFHTVPERLETRAAYEELWRDWEQTNGFRVLGCTSANRRLQLLGTVAVFSHDVTTLLESDGVEETQRERETIVLALQGGRWLGVHEHLSPASPA